MKGKHILRSKKVDTRTITLVQVEDRKEIWIGEYLLGEFTGMPTNVLNTLWNGLNHETLAVLHQLLWSKNQDLADIIRTIISKKHPRLTKKLMTLNIAEPCI